MRVSSYGDIKPANILFDAEDEPYLSDFGLARLADECQEALPSANRVSMPPYISPEQARGEKTDGRIDIYSLIARNLGLVDVTGRLTQRQRPCVPGPHSGTITADETWCLADSPHLMSGDVTVAAGATLTVAPGTTVMVPRNGELYVQGHLQAMGTPTQPILFTSLTNTGMDQWAGLSFDGGTGLIRYAIVCAMPAIPTAFRPSRCPAITRPGTSATAAPSPL